MPLELVLIEDRLAEFRLFPFGPGLAPRLHAVAPDGGQHAGRLLAAHHRDPRVRPHPQEPGAVGAAAHRIVAGAERTADQHRQLGHPGAGHRGDHLGAVLGDAAGLRLAADHEPGDVLQEHQRDAPLAAQLDEVGALQRRFRKQDAVVADDPDRVAVDVGEGANQGRTVKLLELLEVGVVDDAGDHLADVVGLSEIGGNDPVDLLRVVPGLAWFADRHLRCLRPVEIGHHPPGDGERVAVVHGVVVGDPRDPGVDVGAAQRLGGDHLAGRRLDQRRAAEKDRALVLDDDALVGHRRHVGAAGGTRAVDDGDLRHPRRRHGGLVVEDPAEVVAVGKHLVLLGQVGAA